MYKIEEETKDCEKMAMKSRKYIGSYHLKSPKYYPAISQAYWAPQSQTAPYSVPGITADHVTTHILNIPPTFFYFISLSSTSARLFIFLHSYFYSL